MEGWRVEEWKFEVTPVVDFSRAFRKHGGGGQPIKETKRQPTYS